MRVSAFATLLEAMDAGFCVSEMVHDAHGTTIDYRLVDGNQVVAQQTGRVGVVGTSGSTIDPTLELSWLDRYDHVARNGPIATSNQG